MTFMGTINLTSIKLMKADDFLVCVLASHATDRDCNGARIKTPIPYENRDENFNSKKRKGVGPVFK
jgi:hypothetical protein